MSSYLVYRINLSKLSAEDITIEGLNMAPTISHALSHIKHAVREYIVNEEGTKKADAAFELLEPKSEEINDNVELKLQTPLVTSGIYIKYVNDKHSIIVGYRTVTIENVSSWAVFTSQESKINEVPLYKYGYTLIQHPSTSIKIKNNNDSGESPINVSPNTVNSLMSYGKPKDHGQHTALINQLKDTLALRREKMESKPSNVVTDVDEALNKKFKAEQAKRKKKAAEFSKTFRCPSQDSIESESDSDFNDSNILSDSI